MKVTVPVGSVPVIVAVKMTACPAAEGLGEVASAVVVAVEVTDWGTTAEVLIPLLASPPYTAVRLCAPAVVKV